MVGAFFGVNHVFGNAASDRECVRCALNTHLVASRSENAALEVVKRRGLRKTGLFNGVNVGEPNGGCRTYLAKAPPKPAGRTQA